MIMNMCNMLTLYVGGTKSEAETAAIREGARSSNSHMKNVMTMLETPMPRYTSSICLKTREGWDKLDCQQRGHDKARCRSQLKNSTAIEKQHDTSKGAPDKGTALLLTSAMTIPEQRITMERQ